MPPKLLREMNRKYFPLLPSTYFVETGVGEAKIVSTTGSEKKLQTVSTIVQSKYILNKSRDASLGKDKAAYMTETALNFSKEMEKVKKSLVKLSFLKFMIMFFFIYEGNTSRRKS